MSCCGGGRPQNVRKQVVEPVVAPTQVPQKRIGTTHAAKPQSIRRQYLVPRRQCAKCGYPTMLVTIAGRERSQCSNSNCRIIVS